MRHAIQLEILDRVLAQVEAGTTQLGDAESRVPVSRYFAPERLAAEERVLFRRHPLIVGRASELPSPGDFVTTDLGAVPILVLRDAGGALRAFINACRHRGSKLVTEASGHRKGLVCRYHAWAYDLAGSLLHVPMPQAFPDTDCAETGLVRLPVEERHGFVWVTPSPAGGRELGSSLAASLGFIDEDLASFDLASHHLHRRVRCRRRANWKLVIEAFLEGYHVKSLHRDSIYRFFFEAGTVFDAEGPHLRSAGARRAIREARATARERWDIRAYATVFYFLFPNSILVFHPDYVSHLSAVPDGVDHAIYTHHMLVPSAPGSDEERAHWDKTFGFIEANVFQKEDLAIAESIQATVRSGADEHFRIGRVEHGIRLFHDAMDEALARHGEGG